MAGDADSTSVGGVIDPSSTYTHKLISLPDVDLTPRSSDSRSGHGDSGSNPVVVVDHCDEMDNSEMREQCRRMTRSFSSSMDDDLSSEIPLDKACFSRPGGFLEPTAVSSSPGNSMDDYAMSFCRPESATPSPLLDFENRDDEDDSLFPDLVDPAADDEELVDLIIEQATLLSKTILRYLMVMI